MPKVDMNAIYDKMGIQLDRLGCIMMDTEPLKISDVVNEEDLYFRANKERFWIDGIVSEKAPHVTLLFGLMQSGNDYREYVDAVLEDWKLPRVEVDHIDFFGSPYEDEPYYCLIAKLVVTDQLKEANSRLRKLPHIDTYPDYTPHITLAYIKKDNELLDDLLYVLDDRFRGKKVKTIGLNYGK